MDLRVESEATFGVAGPVIDGRATITNLPWTMDEAQLGAALGFEKVHLLNDLSAVATAVPWLAAEPVPALNPGQPAPTGNRAVIAPGTGLGEAFMTWDGACDRTYPSEGGHVDYAPTNLLEIELLGYLLRQHAHVSYEHVCSGRGLPNIYAFLRDEGHAEEPGWLAERLSAAQGYSLPR